MSFKNIKQQLAAFLLRHLVAWIAPSDAVVYLASTGPILARCLYVAAELGIADRLKDGPRTPQQLADGLGVDADALKRVLQALTPIGFFKRSPLGAFENTQHAKVLLTGTPGSLREWVRYAGAPWHWSHWGDLLVTVEKGGDLRNGMLFEWVETNPEIRAQFNSAMESRSRQMDDKIVRLFDFSGFKKIVDVGGGNGHFVHQVAQRQPNLTATVFDIPPTIAAVRRACAFGPQHGQIELAEGDFFKSVPEGGDLYLIRHVLHNWSDAQARIILENCRKAMSPTARLLVVDMLVQEEALAPRTMDVAMLHLLGGRERTAGQFRTLLKLAGFKLDRVIRTPTPMSLLLSSWDVPAVVTETAPSPVRAYT
jgi:ubiquinone/menaquinone biosynthesis C-methylase UbiE